MTHHTAIVLNQVADTRFRVFSDMHGLHDITYRSRTSHGLVRGVSVKLFQSISDTVIPSS